MAKYLYEQIEGKKVNYKHEESESNSIKDTYRFEEDVDFHIAKDTYLYEQIEGKKVNNKFEEIEKGIVKDIDSVNDIYQSEEGHSKKDNIIKVNEAKCEGLVPGHRGLADRSRRFNIGSAPSPPQSASSVGSPPSLMPSTPPCSSSGPVWAAGVVAKDAEFNFERCGKHRNVLIRSDLLREDLQGAGECNPGVGMLPNSLSADMARVPLGPTCGPRIDPNASAEPLAQEITKREVRECESNTCIGGLRNPNRAVAKSATLRKVGVRVRKVLESVVQGIPSTLAKGAKIGTEDAVDFTDREIKFTRKALAKEFNIDYPGQLSGYWAGLFKALIVDSGDLDVDIPDWIDRGFPLGIDRPIVARGIFPATTKDSAAIELSRTFDQIDATGDLASHRNYKSFYEEADAADADFDRIVERGFAERITDAGELRKRFGDIRTPKVAVASKAKKDGSKKIRIIVDMLRSGTNGKIVVRERLVLPRMLDLAESIVDVLECQEGRAKTDKCELFAFDFSDAFYTMHIAEEERRHVIARGSHDWFVFFCVAFGLASGPLLWGRLAAATSRFAQAIFAAHELRIQTYVDDPAGVVAGNTFEDRTRLLVILLLFLRALGFRLSWGKVQRGRTIDWIGARFNLGETDEVTVTLARDKAEHLEKSLKSLLHVSMVHARKAASVAGLASWAASVVPRARPFVSHLWGAIVDSKASREPVRASTRRRPKDLIFVRRFRHSVAWLVALLADDACLVRRFSVGQRHSEVSFILRTDASPYGMGGILLSPGGSVVGYWADVLSADDCARFNAKIGDPAWQTEWEFLAILITIVVFRVELLNMKFVIQTDNTAAISAAMKLSSPKPVMNALAGELALRMEQARATLSLAEHIPGVLNFVADALSRLGAGSRLPVSLAAARRFEAPGRGRDFWLAWPQEWA